MKNQIIKYFLIALLVIIVDQIVKVVVYYNMDMGTQGQIMIFGQWFKLHYLTNPGMAFGMKLNFEYGKLILTVFRIGAMIAIGYYLYSLIQKQANSGLIICIALILGGAIGNLIDSVFYGIWFDNAPYDAPSPWFHGQVIDMFYIDIWEGYLPNWIPLLGGDYMALWPVFNIADASIFVAICFIIVFQKRYFKKEEGHSATEKESTELSGENI
ncbi:lipoprotein signal peptidase [Ekhidna sp.]|uniref:lipoprotein signal peptidase n=1 Tax=Ekhidna sp. TaxID=2608089 RepID=UPI00351522EF